MVKAIASGEFNTPEKVIVGNPDLTPGNRDSAGSRSKNNSIERSNIFRLIAAPARIADGMQENSPARY